VQVNFDAEIRLDIGPFIASINKAQSEVAKLAGQLDALSRKTVSPTVALSGGTSGASSNLAASSARKQMASQEIALQKQADASRATSYREESRRISEINKAHEAAHREEAQRIATINKAHEAALRENTQRTTTMNKAHQAAFAEDTQRTQTMNKMHGMAIREDIQRTKSQADAREAHAQQQQKNLARERYALYDVAAAYTAIATAAAGAVFSTAGTAIAFERAFVDVERTTDFVSAKIGAAADSAMNDLKNLASEIPIAFGQITQIATIGNQLGIAQGSLTSFTETVAKFSTTTGVSVEQTAMSFGRIGELLGVAPEEFNKLGSSIAFAGVNAVATEAQILSVTKEIATTAKMANFSTPDIIGLSTALSSLGIAPEAARGSIIRTFAGINKAISEGGDALQNYAQIAGMPAEEFASTWQDNGKAAFDSFLGGLQGLSDNGENLDTVLRNLGMVNVRDIQTVQKLGDNYDVWAESIRDANKGFEDGTFLAESYGKIQETVASKIVLVSNNIANLLDTIGQSAVGDSFKGFLDIISDVLVKLNQFAKTPIGQVFSAVIVGGAAFIAIFTAINAVSALAQASLRAFATAQSALIGTSASASTAIAGMNTQLGATAVAGNLSALGIDKAKVAAVAMNNFMKTVKWAAVIVAVVYAVQQMAIAFSSAEQKADALLGGFSGAQDALRADLDAYNLALTELGGDTTKAKEATGVIAELNTSFENNNEEINKNIEAKNALNEVLGITSENQGLLSTAVDDTTFYIGANTRAWLINAIAQSDAFQKLSENVDAMKSISGAGFDMNDALQAAGNGTLDQYFQNIQIEAVQTASWFEKMVYGADNLGGAVRFATQDMGFFGNIISWVAEAAGGLVSFLGRAAGEVARFFGFELFPTSIALEDLETATQGAYNQFVLLGPAAKAADDILNGIGSDNPIGDLNNDLEDTAKSLRTVVDYANDLRGVFSRAFEIRFGQQQSLDEIASGWNSIANEAKGAAEAIADANAEINDLTVDKSVLEYQLSVAERYGDEKRVAIIRAKIAKVSVSMGKANEKLATNTAKLSKETEGSSEEAISNREALLGQVGSYSSLIEMYAKTGLQGEALQQKVKELRDAFIQQGLQAGYSRQQLEPYIASFEDMRETIDLVPRNVDIEFDSNVSAAMQAAKEYLAKINEANKTVHTNYTSGFTADPVEVKRLETLVSTLRQDKAAIARTGRSTTGIDTEIDKALSQLRSARGYAAGGYISGSGGTTSDSIPAMLSKGEYVVKASAVGAYGVDFMNAINQQKVGSFGSGQSSSQSASGSSVVYLSPEDRALLRSAVDRPIALYTENSKIAQSANAGNVLLAQRGSN
jgi:TP901 family phage tail tape measure protein